MLEFFEVIHKATGCGFCITNNGNMINIYMIERWHPRLVKKISDGKLVFKREIEVRR